MRFQPFANVKKPFVPSSLLVVQNKLDVLYLPRSYMPKGEGHAHEGRWKDDFNKVGHFPVVNKG